jgi:hypothetical protein
MGNSAGRSIREANTHKLREVALNHRLSRLSYQAIGDTMGISKAYAVKLVRAALDDLAKHTRETAKHLRTIDGAALDKMQSVLWKKVLKADIEATAEVRKILSQRARLFGYDAPVKLDMPGVVSLDAVLAAKDAAKKNDG